MNKNKFTEFFKGKGYYVLLFIGVLAVAAVAVIGSQMSSDINDGQNYVDLNDTEDNITAGEDTQLADNNPVSEGIVNNADNSNFDTAVNDTANQDAAGENQIEYEGYADAEQPDAAEAGSQSVVNEPNEVSETSEAAIPADSTALSFKSEDGLSWPVNGDVIMNYSMDHTVYFATLMKYKCNPAIIIDAEVGTEVKAAADGMVTNINASDEETGYTVTMDIGNGYSVIYGQLDKDSVTFDVGDNVSKGDVIGTIDEPTKYYTLEGGNLYFRVMQDDQTVNPMLLLE